MELRETELGYELKTAAITSFFGKKLANFPSLKEAYPQLLFARLKQTHGDHIVESTDESIESTQEADAHYTKTKKLALIITTADCIPVFFYHHKTKTIAAIHAGWRGVANQIIPKTMVLMNSRGCFNEELQVLIGPHIQKSSFEVEHKVCQQIIETIPLEERQYCFEKISAEKAKVDLNTVARLQIANQGVAAENIFSLYLDTYKDERFHSFRRDRENSGRQISFIALNE